MTSGHNATYAKRSCNLANSLIDYARCTKYSVSSMILLMKYRQYKVEKNIEIRIIRQILNQSKDRKTQRGLTAILDFRQLSKILLNIAVSFLIIVVHTFYTIIYFNTEKTQCSLQELRNEGAIPPWVSNSGGIRKFKGGRVTIPISSTFQTCIHTLC